MTDDPPAPLAGDAGFSERLAVKVLELEREGRVSRTFRRLDPERQSAVIGAILAAAAEAGPTGVGVREVAVRAAVSVGSLYQYFPDRSGMVGAAAEIAGDAIAAELRSYRDCLAALPLRDAFVEYVLGGVEWSEGRADMLRFFARAAYQGDTRLGGVIVEPIAAELRAIVRAMIVAARERGEVRDDVDLDVAARTVHGLALALGDCRLLPHLDAYYGLLGAASLEERAGQLADFVVRAVGDPTGGTPATGRRARRKAGQ